MYLQKRQHHLVDLQNYRMDFHTHIGSGILRYSKEHPHPSNVDKMRRNTLTNYGNGLQCSALRSIHSNNLMSITSCSGCICVFKMENVYFASKRLCVKKK